MRIYQKRAPKDKAEELEDNTILFKLASISPSQRSKSSLNCNLFNREQVISLSQFEFYENPPLCTACI